MWVLSSGLSSSSFQSPNRNFCRETRSERSACICGPHLLLLDNVARVRWRQKQVSCVFSPEKFIQSTRDEKCDHVSAPFRVCAGSFTRQTNDLDASFFNTFSPERARAAFGNRLSQQRSFFLRVSHSSQASIARVQGTHDDALEGALAMADSWLGRLLFLSPHVTISSPFLSEFNNSLVDDPDDGQPRKGGNSSSPALHSSPADPQH